MDFTVLILTSLKSVVWCNDTNYKLIILCSQEYCVGGLFNGNASSWVVSGLQCYLVRHYSALSQSQNPLLDSWSAYSTQLLVAVWVRHPHGTIRQRHIWICLCYHTGITPRLRPLICRSNFTALRRIRLGSNKCSLIGYFIDDKPNHRCIGNTKPKYTARNMLSF